MIKLVKTYKNRNTNIFGYVWQKSSAGYDYEVEIMHKDGTELYKQNVLEAFEVADEVAHDLMFAASYEDTYKTFEY